MKIKTHTNITGRKKRGISARILALAVAVFCCSLSFAQTITITGTVYDDGNGGTIGGSPVSTVNSTQLYVYLIVNSSNTIVGKSAVAAFSGTYSLTGSSNSNYAVALSSNNYSINTSNPNLGLPSNWVATAEGTTALGDGTPDFSVAINSSTNLTINFGIDQRPLGNNTSIISFSYDGIGRVIIPYYAFTGNDLEDGTYTAGFMGRDMDLYQATGGSLYYAGALVNFTSANTATRLTSFDYNLLRFQVASGATHEFAYSIVDNANKVELVPNSVTLGIPLQVKLADFNVKAVGQTNIVQWTLASEKDNAGAEIERSIDGISFSVIGSVEPYSMNGRSGNASIYTYTDYSAASLYSPGGVYYRVKQLDISGTHEYSRVLKVSGVNSFDTWLSIFPNPSMGSLSFDIATGSGNAEQLNITVISTTGQPVYSAGVNAQGGRISTALDLRTLPAGQYYVQVKGVTTVFPVQHIVIMPH